MMTACIPATKVDTVIDTCSVCVPLNNVSVKFPIVKLLNSKETKPQESELVVMLVPVKLPLRKSPPSVVATSGTFATVLFPAENVIRIALMASESVQSPVEIS